MLAGLALGVCLSWLVSHSITRHGPYGRAAKYVSPALSGICGKLTAFTDIDRKVPELVTRIWPARFVEPAATEADGEDGMEYRGCYLIGLEWNEDRDDVHTKSASETAESSLVSVLRQFEGRIRGDEKYYDPKTSWMAATVVRGNEVSSLELDTNDWGEVGVVGDDSDSDFDDDDENVELEEQQGETLALNKPPRAVKPPGAGKLRPAADVMSRLRWDDSMDSSDFVVGYEDRFAGIMEKELAEWKSEQTDEEFIPQHRIAYFKRRSDGVVVWDRAARVDLVFGSG